MIYANVIIDAQVEDLCWCVLYKQVCDFCIRFVLIFCISKKEQAQEKNLETPEGCIKMRD